MHAQLSIAGFTALFAAEGNLPEFLNRIAGFLGGYYLVLAIINSLMALYLWQKRGAIGAGAVLDRRGGGVCDSLAAGREWTSRHDAAIASIDS